MRKIKDIGSAADLDDALDSLGEDLLSPADQRRRGRSVRGYRPTDDAAARLRNRRG
ncbi:MULTISPECIES: hypothetical protein [Actinomadura]|uniref:hypothetical protein n=1 Tax=Actinomadura sp. NPDC000929 TaxID=3154517 RepID=UPI003396866C